MPFRRGLFAGAILVWGTFILLGGRMLLDYEARPGKAAQAPSQWPAGSGIVRPSGKFTLVMLAHPDCPCSRASITELEQLIARLKDRLGVFVVFRKPGAGTEEVQGSDLWKSAAAIPGVTVVYDGNGSEIERFGSSVSGQTVLYDTAGRLAFSGGITAGRGHEGYNPGEDAVIRSVNGEVPAAFRAPVFGCSLHDPDARQLEEETSWKKR